MPPFPTEQNVEVVYRDEHLIVVNKPSGMIIHRGWDNDPVTVADIVRDKIAGIPVHAVHRLDRGTSGLIIFATSAQIAAFVQSQFTSGAIEKLYICLVRGPMKEASVVDHAIPNGKDKERVPAVTGFRPLAHKDRWSLVEASPRTGRMHQVRRHLKHISHPIVGDVRYGKGEINRFFKEEYGLCRLALHCLSLSFLHPNGDKLTLQAGLPPDLTEPLARLGISLS